MKKSQSRLPKLFSRFFGVLEFLSPIGGLLACVLMAVLPALSSQPLELELGLDVGLVPESGALTVLTSDSKGEMINIKNLQGTVSVRGPGSGLCSFVRWHTLPVVIVYAGFMTVLFDLLRRLFRHVERGESFTEPSVRLVHKIGVTIIVFTLLSAAAWTWHTHAVTSYLEQHATVQGIKMAFATPPPNSNCARVTLGNAQFQINVVGILTGLLVLSLGEVFRQGLALKEESDLTI